MSYVIFFLFNERSVGRRILCDAMTHCSSLQQAIQKPRILLIQQSQGEWNRDNDGTASSREDDGSYICH